MHAVLEKPKHLTAVELYEQFRQGAAEDGIEVAPWEQLPVWERAQWEARAEEERAGNHPGR